MAYVGEGARVWFPLLSFLYLSRRWFEPHKCAVTHLKCIELSRAGGFSGFLHFSSVGAPRDADAWIRAVIVAPKCLGQGGSTRDLRAEPRDTVPLSTHPLPPSYISVKCLPCSFRLSGLPTMSDREASPSPIYGRIKNHFDSAFFRSTTVSSVHRSWQRIFSFHSLTTRSNFIALTEGVR